MSGPGGPGERHCLGATAGPDGAARHLTFPLTAFGSLPPMLHLRNADLAVDLLDPAADRERLGARFCSGGYIWQVHDRTAGALLSGPEWPDPAPRPDNGQGLPEAFRHRTTDGRPLLWDGPIGFAPGIGTLACAATGATVVVEPCRWQVETQRDRIVFRSTQTVGRWSCEVVRTLELVGRRLRSSSRLTNLGAVALVLEWFAHPFFPLGADGRFRAVMPAGAAVPPNPSYFFAGRELALRRAFRGIDDGLLVRLQLPSARHLRATIDHPQLAQVTFATDFAPAQCVLWANSRTFSLEPFLALALAPQASRAWTLTYDFGPVRTDGT